MGKCQSNGDCNYSDSHTISTTLDNNQKKDSIGAFSTKNRDNLDYYQFPVNSSYLDLVALGTTATNIKVTEVTFNGEPISLTTTAAYENNNQQGDFFYFSLSILNPDYL